MNTITPFLWFDNNAQEAAKFYSTIFKEAKITVDSPMSVQFELNGQRFIGLNGGPMYQFNEAVSFVVSCDNQEEVDYYWKALSDGGKESKCGWLKDKFGLSWQIVPKQLGEYITSADRTAAGRALQAMLEMNKIEIEVLQKAYEDK